MSLQVGQEAADCGRKARRANLIEYSLWVPHEALAVPVLVVCLRSIWGC